MEFNDLQTTKFGTLAEDIVINEFILSKGYIPYKPSVSMSHPFDGIAATMSAGTEWYLDVKAKSRMVYMPMTGIDIADWNKYLTYKQPVYLLFCDPTMGEIYGQWCTRLINQPSNKYGDVIVWPLSAMTHYRYMNESEIGALKQLENSNYR